jgi:hypothetical protein
LKAPRIRDSAARLADQARDQGWSHDEYLAAVLSREVSSRESSGAEIRIRAAGFPARKAIEEFNFDHQPTLKRDTVAHLSTSQFIVKAQNVVLLGPSRLVNTALSFYQGVSNSPCWSGLTWIRSPLRRPRLTWTACSSPRWTLCNTVCRATPSAAAASSRPSQPSGTSGRIRSRFLVTFLLGGLTGVLLASPPIDFHVTDTYFVVAHFHYVLFGTIVFATYAGIYFWFPKMTGRLLDERLGKLHFWLTFIGFHTTFLVQHWLGDEGMPRRYADYLPTDGFTTLNIVSTIGAFILGVSIIPFVWNVFKSWRYGEPVTVDDPWGYGNSLEWATSCPPPRHNFTELPRIRSERLAFELHYPHMVQRIRAEAHVGRHATVAESPSGFGPRTEPDR